MSTSYGNIVGWGKYIPERVVTNQDLEKIVDTTDEWIIEYTGIRERHHVSEDEQTSQMAVGAAQEALRKAGIHAHDLDLIIVATSSPDYLTPPISSQVQHMLGAGRLGAFTLVAGCTGFIYGLATAQQFIAAGSCERVLVIGVELISRWIDKSDRSTCVLFGDGAGAVVLEATDKPSGVLSYVLGSDGSQAGHLILPGGGSVCPPSHEMLDKRLNYVHMNGQAVFKFASRVWAPSLRESLRKAGLKAKDIDLFIPHQANKRIIDSVARQMGFPPEKVFINIHKYGNTSAASIPIALCEALDTGRAKVGDTLAMVSVGAGLTWASAIVKVVERERIKKRRFWQLPLARWFRRNGHRETETVEAVPEEMRV
jgi:3-oxoacyl-[acyl-carrier-protein] synthase III